MLNEYDKIDSRKVTMAMKRLPKALDEIYVMTGGCGFEWENIIRNKTLRDNRLLCGIMDNHCLEAKTGNNPRDWHFIKPDGGVLWIKEQLSNGAFFYHMVCTSEMKAQGCKTANSGNAIERLFKNPLKVWEYSTTAILPFVVFCHGKSFIEACVEEKLRTNRDYNMVQIKPYMEMPQYPNGTVYTLQKPVFTIYAREKDYTEDELFEVLFEVSCQAIEHLRDNELKGKIFLRSEMKDLENSSESSILK